MQFGGVCFLLVRDLSQLPPVFNHSFWNLIIKSDVGARGKSLSGFFIYFLDWISGIVLIINIMMWGVYSFLKRLRDGVNTDRYWVVFR